MRATRAVIHLEHLAANIAAIQTYCGGHPRLCLPVKAAAYGHGAAVVAHAALGAGAALLAVAAVDEGIELREAGINAPVLLFSPPLPEEWEAAAHFRLTPLVSNAAMIDDFARAAQKTGAAASVFLKIDTGMHRTGCEPAEAAGLARAIRAAGLALTGCVTHFAAADSAHAADTALTRRQLDLFCGAAQKIRAAGLDPGLLSAANSGAVFGCPDARLDVIRPGIACYGYYRVPGHNAPPLLPVMELVTQIVLIKKIAAGETVSYGGAWTASADTHIGILPIGYADGLPRRLSTTDANTAGGGAADANGAAFSVAINGARYPLAGRICMDMCAVDLGARPAVSLYDAVTLFGPAPPALDAADVAALCGTIPYEITCGISKRVPRVYRQ